MKDKYIGAEYLATTGDHFRVFKFDEGFKKYLACKNVKMNGLYQILSPEDIDRALNMQDKIIESQEKARAREEKIEQEEDRQAAAESQAKKEYKDVKGYNKRRTPKAKERILKNLNTLQDYAQQGKQLGVMRRKDFILKVLKEGYKPLRLEDRKDKNRLAKGESYYSVTNIEIDYANYLMKKL